MLFDKTAPSLVLKPAFYLRVLKEKEKVQLKRKEKEATNLFHNWSTNREFAVSRIHMGSTTSDE